MIGDGVISLDNPVVREFAEDAVADIAKLYLDADKTFTTKCASGNSDIISFLPIPRLTSRDSFIKNACGTKWIPAMLNLCCGKGFTAEESASCISSSLKRLYPQLDFPGMVVSETEDEVVEAAFVCGT